MGTALGIGIGIPFQNASGAVDAYLVNDLSPDLVADFAGILNSGTPYYRQGGAEAAFADFLVDARASTATMVDSDGLLKWAPHNLCINSAALGSWNIGGSAAVSSNDATDPDGGATADTVTFSAGTDRVFQTNVFTATAGVQFTFAAWARSDTVTSLLMGFNGRTNGANNVASTAKTISATWTLVEVDFTVVGSDTGLISVFGYNSSGGGSPQAGDVELWGAHIYRSDLGGMVDNPDRGDSYIPTTSAARYLARRNHHRWNGSAWVNKGILVESEARTQLLHTTNALVTQSHTVTAVPHTLHFTGTGTVTLSGASTAGPLVGTGTGEGNRVSLTFTPSAASLTLTVSGTVTNAQLEIGSTPSSYIPNTAGSGTVTRAAETLTIAGADMPVGNGITIQMSGEINYADTGIAVSSNGDTGDAIFWFWGTNNAEFINAVVRTDGARTGEIYTQARNTYIQSPANPTELTPGNATPFSVAFRGSPSGRSNAVNGNAATADATTFTSGPNMGNHPFLILRAYNTTTLSNGTIELIRVWNVDLGDTGIEDATS